MPTSSETGDGTSNAERIAVEIEQAAQVLVERFSGYRLEVARAAMECYLLTAEHDEQRININQKYDALISNLAHDVGKKSRVEA